MADPASLLSAAVRAACLAKAPRRTVQAVAAAVTAVLVKQDVARPGTEPKVTVGVPGTVVGAGEKQVLVDQLREARRAKRQRKRQRRRERAQAAVAPSMCSDAKAVTLTADHSKRVGQQGFSTWEEAYNATGMPATTVETFSESESMSDVAVGKRTTSDDFAFGAASELNRPRRDLRRPTEGFQALKTAAHGPHRKDRQIKTPSQPEAASVEKERRVPKPDRPRKQPTGPY